MGSDPSLVVLSADSTGPFQTSTHHPSCALERYPQYERAGLTDPQTVMNYELHLLVPCCPNSAQQEPVSAFGRAQRDTESKRILEFTEDTDTGRPPPACPASPFGKAAGAPSLRGLVPAPSPQPLSPVEHLSPVELRGLCDEPESERRRSCLRATLGTSPLGEESSSADTAFGELPASVGEPRLEGAPGGLPDELPRLLKRCTMLPTELPLLVVVARFRTQSGAAAPRAVCGHKREQAVSGEREVTGRTVRAGEAVVPHARVNGVSHLCCAA